MKYTTLLFDADGTLYDFKKAEEKALESFYRIKKIPVTFEFFKKVYENENSQLWEALEDGLITPEEVKVRRFENTMKKLSLYENDAEVLSELFISELAQCDFLLDGAAELIDNISSLYKLIIITNGLWDVQKIRIGESDLFRHFESLIVSEKVGYAKPDGRIFDSAFSAASHPAKDDVLIIGDSLSSDIRGGALYGIDTCWFNPEGKALKGEVKPTYEIHSFKSLEELLL